MLHGQEPGFTPAGREPASVTDDDISQKNALEVSRIKKQKNPALAFMQTTLSAINFDKYFIAIKTTNHLPHFIYRQIVSEKRALLLDSRSEISCKSL